MAVDRFILLSLIKEVINQENQGCVVNCSECEFVEWCTKLESFLKRIKETDILAVNDLEAVTPRNNTINKGLKNNLESSCSSPARSCC